MEHLAGKGGERRFVGVDLATGPQKGAGAALAHEKQSTLSVANDRCRDSNRCAHGRTVQLSGDIHLLGGGT